MKKALALVALLAVVGSVSAAIDPADFHIQLFWSTTGKSGALQYSTAMTNFLPFDAPTPVADLAPGSHDLFLWGRFVDDDDSYSYTQIYGLDLAKSGTFGSNVAYRQNKTGSGAYKRWDGSAGIALDGVMAAVTARGIEYILPPDTNNDLYLPASKEFLIGAANVTGADGDVAVVSLDVAEGLGIAMRWIGGEDIEDPEVYSATVTFTPEPASILLALVGLALRRR